jgi:hypothetical protein
VCCKQTPKQPARVNNYFCSLSLRAHNSQHYIFYALLAHHGDMYLFVHKRAPIIFYLHADSRACDSATHNFIASLSLSLSERTQNSQRFNFLHSSLAQLHTSASTLLEPCNMHANFYALPTLLSCLLACLIFSSKKRSHIGFWSAPSTRQAGEKKVRRENNFFTARKIFSPAGRAEGADQKPIKN